jgi:hypothetical protein
LDQDCVRLSAIETSSIYIACKGRISKAIFSVLSIQRSFCGNEVVLDLLESNEHNDVPTSETHELGSEALVEGEGSLL